MDSRFKLPGRDNLLLIFQVHNNETIPCPGGVIYVFLTFDSTIPSWIMPIPILFALPSNPIAMVIVNRKKILLQTARDQIPVVYIIYM